VRELASKLVAGGLSAAVILLWWPQFFPADTATAWLARGVVWTLSFELMLLALAPLERSLWETAAVRRVRSRAGSRLAPGQRLGSRTAVACAALAVPAVLLATAPAPNRDKPAVTAVKEVTEVKRIVRVEHAPGGAAPRPAAPAGTASEGPSSPPATSTRTRRPSSAERRRASGPRRSGGSGAPAPAPGPPDPRQPVQPGSGDDAGTPDAAAQPDAAQPRTDAAQRTAV
jgi:hypothetical protein